MVRSGDISSRPHSSRARPSRGRHPLRNSLMMSAALSVTLAGTVAGTVAAQDVDIATATATPVATSTANGGSAANVTISANGSINLTSGTAATLDSNNTLDLTGAITIDPGDDSTGVLLGTAAGSYTQSGSITLERTVAQETEAEPDYGDNRSGLRLGGGNVFTGDVALASGSTINLFGDQSAAIRIDGTLAGDLDIGSGSFLTVEGIDSSAIDVNGSITGQLRIGGTLNVTGYANVPTSSADPAADFVLNAVQAARQSGNAVDIRGNIGAGVLIDGPLPAAHIPDGESAVNSAVISISGGSNAVYLGASTIGLVSDDGVADPATYGSFGFINRGTIQATGVFDDATNLATPPDAPLYRGVSARGITFDGTSVSGGMRNDGAIQVSANNGDALGMAIIGASVPAVFNNGTLQATTRVDNVLTGTNAIGIDIGAGSTVTTLTNTNTISADTIGDIGTAIGVRDTSNTLATIVNRGVVSAVVRDFSDGDSATTADAALPVNTGLAFDLSTNTIGVNFLNTVSVDFDPATDLRSTFGNIFGDIKLGSGNDTFHTDAGVILGNLNVGDGNDTVVFDLGSSIAGGINLGNGSNNVTFDNGAIGIGDLIFGTGADSLILRNDSSYSGALVNAGGSLDITVDNAALRLGALTNTTITNLTMTDGSRLGIGISEGGADIAALTVSGTAMLTGVVTVTPIFEGAITNDSTVAILTAGTLDLTNGSFDLGAAEVDSDLPFLFENSQLRLDPTDANTLLLDIDRKSADEIGLSKLIAGAYEPTIAAIAQDAVLGAAVFNLNTEAEFSEAFSQLLSAPLDAPIAYARTANNSINSIIAERLKLAKSSGTLQKTFWLQESSFFVNRDDDSGSNGFDGGGWIIAAGADAAFGPFDAIGIDVSATSARYDEQAGNDFPFTRFGLGLGAYSSMSFDKIRLDTNLRYTQTNSESERNFVLGTVIRRTTAEWDGTEIAGSVKATYDMGEQRGFTLAPFAGVDFLQVEEDAYEESGGGAGIDLAVAAREMTSARANVGVSIGKVIERKPNIYDTGIPAIIKPELTIAWSQELSDEIVESDVRYVSGTDNFTLMSNQDKGVGIIGVNVGYENEYAKVHLGLNGAFGDVSESVALVAGVGLKW